MDATDSKPKRSALRGILFAAAILAWLGAIGVGFAWLWQYKMTPGPAQSAPPVWPSDSTIERAPGAPTLVMFAHPLCPCTRASVAELGTLVQRAGALDVHVLMLRPDDVGPEWDDTLLTTASGIPGVRISRDRNGDEARRFGVRTSGHVVIYGADGRLLFTGGITGARGHVGDNVGLDRALGALATCDGGPASCPVFGCCLESHQ